MKGLMMTIAALSVASALFADDDIADLESATKAMIANATATNEAQKAFTTLPLCRRVEGRALVRKPGKEWEPVEEGRFYPFGSSYRAEKGGVLDIAFGTSAIATIQDGSEFGTRSQPVGVQSRTIVLMGGTIDLKLPDNLQEGAFFLTAPGFTIKNPAGTSIITYADKGDGDEATVLCKTGSLGIEGRHFDIPAMHAADTVRIRTSRDHLFTALYGETGNYVVNLDQGICTREELGDDGSMSVIVEKGNLAWHLSPKTQVVINRSVPAIGERMSVHTMTFDARGVVQNERAFSEGRAEVNSGELVMKKKAVDGEELARKAAEMTETTAATDTEDVPAETTSDEE